MHAGFQLQPVCAKQQCLPAWSAQPSGSILLTKSQGHMASCCISSHHAKALEVCWTTLSGGERRGLLRCCSSPTGPPWWSAVGSADGRPSVFSACKLLLSFQLLSRCKPNYTCGELHRHAFWLFSSDGSFTSAHLSSFSFTSAALLIYLAADLN